MSQSIRQMYFEEFYPMYPYVSIVHHVFIRIFIHFLWKHMETHGGTACIEPRRNRQPSMAHLCRGPALRRKYTNQTHVVLIRYIIS